MADAEEVTRKLLAASTDSERAKIIKRKESLWRDDRIRNWLLEQFANKCWYTEAYDSVSSIHVDHYRPKGRAKDLDGNECEGYWWLAFNWKNYRICGQLINVKKLDMFPLLEGVRADNLGGIVIELESPLLIDPLTDQTRLISYEKDEDACVAVPAAGVTPKEEFRAEKTIEVLGLNRLDRLNKKRADYWDKCLMAIADYKGADGPYVMRLIHQASALSRLKEMVTYEAEFSSVSEACIRKNAPGSLIACVFEQLPR
ncbi:MAG: hypothetical protein R3E79_26910 [Caldilineaceae bacterium]